MASPSSRFTPPQLAYLARARKIAPVALDHETTLYRFYRYATPHDKRTVDAAIIHGHFRFARPREFNDPFDCRPHMHLPGLTPWLRQRRFVRESLALARRRFPADPAGAERKARDDLARSTPEDLVAASEQSIRRTLLDTQRMLCLCANRKHVLMWAYYSHGHQGVVIHLNPQVWPIAAAMRVRYSNRYPTVPLYIGRDDPRLTRRFGLTKSKTWRHEAEYRVLTHDQDPQRFGLEWESEDTATLPPEAVIGVTVGCLMPAPVVQQVLTAARAATPAVPVFRAVEDRKRFKLEFEPIP